MESLTERFDAVQENLLELYESGSDNIEDQILYWNLMRKEGVLFYYARQKGITRLGLQHVPSLAVSEFKAKQAIMMTLQLESLKNSEYGSEKWTMQDTSLELYNTEPQHTFKKEDRLLMYIMIIMNKIIILIPYGNTFIIKLTMTNGTKHRVMWTMREFIMSLLIMLSIIM